MPAARSLISVFLDSRSAAATSAVVVAKVIVVIRDRRWIKRIPGYWRSFRRDERGSKKGKDNPFSGYKKAMIISFFWPRTSPG